MLVSLMLFKLKEITFLTHGFLLEKIMIKIKIIIQNHV